jgi:hypothetical protein
MSLGAAGISAPMAIARQWGIDINKPVNDPLYQFFERLPDNIVYWGAWIPQLFLNSVNGVTDALFGLYNIAAYLGNTGLWLGTFGLLSTPIPYIPDWDWSRNLIVQENDELHDWSKWIGGSVLTWGAGYLFAPKMSIALVRSSNPAQKTHFAYRVGETWYDAVLYRGSTTMELRSFDSKAKLLENWSRSVISSREVILPILFPRFASGTEVVGMAPYNCLTAAIRAWFSGGGAIFPAIPFLQLAHP